MPLRHQLHSIRYRLPSFTGLRIDRLLLLIREYKRIHVAHQYRRRHHLDLSQTFSIHMHLLLSRRSAPKGSSSNPKPLPPQPITLIHGGIPSLHIIPTVARCQSGLIRLVADRYGSLPRAVKLGVVGSKIRSLPLPLGFPRFNIYSTVLCCILRTNNSLFLHTNL